MIGDGETEGGNGAEAKMREFGGGGLGLKWAAMSVWARETDIERSRRELALGACSQSGGRRMTPARRKKGEKEGEKGACPFADSGKRGRGAGASRQREEGRGSVPWRLARGVAGAGR
uniref:Uncharacterized protein n=1 Tax=Oryza sativa subsp. japonica TaxID=39947 RepID=Q6Z8J6_ORYSJ|nr:hypothetical protein [Oryza sativa Japonica Group]